MKSGVLDFSSPIYVLAPLAGLTDLPFRSVVKKFGADLTVSEMISSNALVHNSKKSLKMVEKSPLENPYSVQIAGSDEDVVRRAVEILNGLDGIDIIDLNCGCPVPKVVSHGSGSSLLKDLDKMERIEIDETDDRVMKLRFPPAPRAFFSSAPKPIASPSASKTGISTFSCLAPMKS